MSDLLSKIQIDENTTVLVENAACSVSHITMQQFVTLFQRAKSIKCLLSLARIFAVKIEPVCADDWLDALDSLFKQKIDDCQKIDLIHKIGHACIKTTIAPAEKLRNLLTTNVSQEFQLDMAKAILCYAKYYVGDLKQMFPAEMLNESTQKKDDALFQYEIGDILPETL